MSAESRTIARGCDLSSSSPAVHPKTTARIARASQPLPAAIALLSRADVARALGVSPLTVFRWTKAGLLHSLKLGDGDVRAPVRYRASDIAAFIESRLGVGATE
jgi:Helix-turn-helix domain